jgi:hypothetical protein
MAPSSAEGALFAHLDWQIDFRMASRGDDAEHLKPTLILND